MIEIKKKQTTTKKQIYHCLNMVYIWRILYGRAEMGKFSSSVEKYFTRSLRSLVNILFNMRREI